MTGPRQPVALLIAFSPGTEKAGEAMRCRALYEALGRDGHCQVVAIRCDQRSQCKELCAVTGGQLTGATVSSWYFTHNYCDDRADQIAQELVVAGVRTVVCTGLLTHRYAIRLSRYKELCVIYDMHNIELPLRRDMLTWSREADVKFRFDSNMELLREWEGSAIGAADQVWTCSVADAMLLRQTYPEHASKEIYVVPNVVQVTAEPPYPVLAPSRITFTGHLGWYPNVLAAHCLINEIAPALRRLGCDVPIVIAGSSPRQEILEAAADSAANVRVIADPETTADLIAGSIMTVPLTIGGGTRLKVLEAFAMGAPVVSTSKGVEGLDLMPSTHYAEAEEPEEFALSIAEMLADEPGRAKMVAAAWRIVSESYSIEALRKALIDILD
jgi:glycosyltransferase involved in cell wall biosynthesis